MIEVETPYHISKSDADEKPTYKCRGTCLKVFWPVDIEQGPFGMQPACPKCGGLLTAAIEGQDYKVVAFEPGAKLFPDTNLKMHHVSGLKDEYIGLQKKFGWK